MPLVSSFNARPPSVLLNQQMEPMRTANVSGVAFNLWNNVWSTNYPFFYPYRIFQGSDPNFTYVFEIEF